MTVTSGGTMDRKGLQEIKVAGIWLRRERHHVVVLAEKWDGEKYTWVEIIREFWDSQFSHIVEPDGIANKFGGESGVEL